jgi:CRISPR-associated protein (TIGR02710 family)
MKILFTTVGTGRNRKDIAEAIVYGIDYHKPELIYFFCSNKTAEETMPEIKQLLDGKYDSRTVIYENEDDVQYLYGAYITDMRPHNCGDNELIVDFTSGTKAMSAAMFSAGIAVDAKEVSYIIGQRDQTGRVIKSTGVTSIKPGEVIARREIEKARSLFNEMDYSAAAILAAKCEKDLPHSKVKMMAKTIASLSNAYRLWEQYKWQSASDEIKGLVRGNDFLTEEQKQTLKNSGNFCKKVSNGSYSYERLIDLEQNALRRLKQHRYDDAVARLYRAIEYFIQIRFKTQFSFELSQMGKDDFDCLCATYSICKETESKINSYFNRSNNGKLRLALRDSMEFLAELNDEAGRYITISYWNSDWKPGIRYNEYVSGKLQNWLKERNNSYLAHGTDPVSSSTASNLMSFYSELLDKFAEGDLEQMRKAAEFIKL